MLTRIVYTGIGVGLGVLAMRKAGQVRRAASAEGLNRTLARVADAFAESAEAFRAGMDAREAELRGQLGLEGPSAPARRH